MRKSALIAGGIRLLAAIFLFMSLRLAWAGVWVYQGEQAFNRKDFPLAFESFEKAKPWDSQNTRLLFYGGQSAWQEGIAQKNKDLLEKAEKAFEELVRRVPRYGRFRVWLAMAETAVSHEISSQKWAKLQKMLKKAALLEPGSAWTAYQSGTLFLKHEQFLSAPEKEGALEEIRRAVSFHVPDESALYLPSSSPYLGPALSFLWEKHGDFGKLKFVTPADFASHKKLLEFMDAKGLWRFREEIHNTYLDLEEKSYEVECARAEAWFAAGKYRQAYFGFRKAFWMRSWAYTRAKAGVLASEEKLGELREGVHGLFHQEERAILKEILEDEDQPLGFLLTTLGPAVRKMKDPELQERYDLRLKHDEKIESMPVKSLELPAEGWWRHENKITLELKLEPGSYLLKAIARSTKGAYGVLRLNERELKGFWFPAGGVGRKIEVPLTTSGGRRWLTLELIHQNAGEKGTDLTTGPVKLVPLNQEGNL